MEKRCKNCGRITIQLPGRKEKKFCSDVCRRRYWIKPEHGEGIKPRIVTACAKCGKSIEQLASQGRKYCSHACYIADRFGEKAESQASIDERLMTLIGEMSKAAPEPEYDGSEDAPQMEGPESAIPEMPEMPLRAARADEKLRPKRVYLLAGNYHFVGKYDHFAGLIPLADQSGLMEGDVYVYCNKQRTQLGILQWQGSGFALFFKRIEYERYPWPFSVAPKLVEIEPNELRMLLEMPRLAKRLSGKF